MSGRLNMNCNARLRAEVEWIVRLISRNLDYLSTEDRRCDQIGKTKPHPQARLCSGIEADVRFAPQIRRNKFVHFTHKSHK
jgi:hypothetical protein